MKKLVTSLLVIAALLVFAAGALAGGKITSQVAFDGADAVPADNSKEFVAGHVSSVSNQCEKNRTVKIFAFYGGSSIPVPFDTAKTGKNGGFSGIGPEASGGQDIAGAKLKLAAKSIGSKTCSGDTEFAKN